MSARLGGCGASQARGEHDILPSLPAGLRSQLDIFKKREIFTSLPLFQECSYEQVIDLVKGVERIFTIPGRILIQEGILADGLYMIVSGSVSILSKSGTILATRVVGEVLGENSLLETTPARATCITTAFWCAAHVQPWHDPCRVSMAGAAAIIAHGSVPELLISLNALRTVPLTCAATHSMSFAHHRQHTRPVSAGVPQRCLRPRTHAVPRVPVAL